eukprot:3428229-Pleurochrysis_carterae.AAC.2
MADNVCGDAGDRGQCTSQRDGYRREGRNRWPGCATAGGRRCAAQTMESSRRSLLVIVTWFPATASTVPASSSCTIDEFAE